MFPIQRNEKSISGIKFDPKFAEFQMSTTSNSQLAPSRIVTQTQSMESLKITTLPSSPSSSVILRTVSAVSTPKKSDYESLDVPKKVISLLSAEDLEAEYKNRRAEIVGPGFVSTPLHVLKTLVNAQETEIHTDIFRLGFANSPEKIIWRVEIFVQELSGIGQSLKRSLSLQLAAADILEKVRGNYPNYKLPVYGILPGSCIPSTVHKDLIQFCQKNQLPKPYFEHLKPDNDVNELSKFIIRCSIGNHKMTGRSDNHILASRIAARRMLECISGQIYPNENATTGDNCGSISDLGTLTTVPIISAGKQRWIKKNQEENLAQRAFMDEDCMSSFEDSGLDVDDDEWFDAEAEFAYNI